MNKILENYYIKEKSTTDLFKVIFASYKATTTSKYNKIFTILLLFLIIPIIIFYFNSLHIRVSIIYDLLKNLLDMLSILIGFAITAISIIGTGLSSKVLKPLFENESLQNNQKTVKTKYSIYHTTILLFFGYIYILLITLFFSVFCLFLYPYAHFLSNLRLQISIAFFYIFIELIYFNIFSIKSLLFNLYCIIMLNAQIETMEN